jgi:uncharacterized membrane protein
MANAPIQAAVDCTDGECGQSQALIVHPLTRKVTHLVVREQGGKEAAQRLVPVDQVAGVTHDRVSLRCTKAELAGFESFIEEQWRLSAHADYHHAPVDPTGMMVGHIPTESYYVHEQVERVPEGELAVSTGTKVQAQDGEVGHVAELVVDPATREVTHFVLERRHGRSRRHTILPLSVVDYVAENTVYLKLERQELDLLPAVPARSKRGAWAGAEIELVGAVYESTTGADEALQWVSQLHYKQTLRIRNAAVLVKEPDGKIVVKERGDFDARQGAIGGAVLGGVVGLLTGGVSLVGGALVGAVAGGVAAHEGDRGFSDRFLRSLAEHLQPGRSGLLLVVQHDWVVPLKTALARDEHVFLQQELTDRLVAELTGQPSAAPGKAQRAHKAEQPGAG